MPTNRSPNMGGYLYCVAYAIQGLDKICWTSEPLLSSQNLTQVWVRVKTFAVLTIRETLRVFPNPQGLSVR
jgi:hypothetical protein